VRLIPSQNTARTLLKSRRKITRSAALPGSRLPVLRPIPSSSAGFNDAILTASWTGAPVNFMNRRTPSFNRMLLPTSVPLSA